MMLLNSWILLYIIAWLYGIHSVTSVCFDPDIELGICQRKYSINKTNKGKGFAFGFGSLNDTEFMCKTRWHIKVFDCLLRKVQSQCHMTQLDYYLKLIWEFTLDTSRFKKGASYICDNHNLKMFNSYKNGCLKRQESQANNCARLKSQTKTEALNKLNSKSPKLEHSTLDQYSVYVKEILIKYECKGRLLQLECLYEILHMQCPPDATRLILNYFKELLADNCHYDYERQLLEYIKSDYYRRTRNQGTEAADEGISDSYPQHPGYLGNQQQMKQPEAQKTLQDNSPRKSSFLISPIISLIMSSYIIIFYLVNYCKILSCDIL